MAIIVPDQEVLEPYARERNIPGNMAELCKNKVSDSRRFVIFLLFFIDRSSIRLLET